MAVVNFTTEQWIILTVASIQCIGLFVYTIVHALNRAKSANSQTGKRQLIMKVILIVLLVSIFACLPLLLQAMRSEIDCPGCLQPGIFYSCKKNTGYGSATCEEYMDFRRKFEKLFTDITDSISAIKRITNTTFGTVTELKKALQEAANKISSIRVPSIPSPSIGNIKIKECKIPVIDQDICSGLSVAINAALIKPLENAVSGAVNSINEASKTVSDVVSYPITVATTELEKITTLIESKIEEIKKDVYELMGIYNTITDIIDSTSITNLAKSFITDQLNVLFSGGQGKIVITIIIFILIMLIVAIIFGSVNSAATFAQLLRSGTDTTDKEEVSNVEGGTEMPASTTGV